MRKFLFPILISFSFYLCGCSLPTTASYRELYSFTKEEKKIKGLMGKKKEILLKDFRGNDRYEEEMAGLKEEVEKYITGHPDLNEPVKNDLRELKVSEASTKEEVRLLLGNPDKILTVGGRDRYAASEIWIYKISKMNAFTVFIVPIFFAHEGYYLYFKDDVLAGIERHYLTQVVQQSPGPGVFQKTGTAP